MNELTKNLINCAFTAGVFTLGYFIGRSNGREAALEEVQAEFLGKQPIAVFYQDFTNDNRVDVLNVYRDNSWCLFEPERDAIFSKDSKLTGYVPPSLSSRDEINDDNREIVKKINSTIEEKLEGEEK